MSDINFDDEFWRVASGGSAGINSTTFYACYSCGACVAENYGSTISRQRHADWHESPAIRLLGEPQ